MVKDKKTRRSKGVAFVLFLSTDDAKNCAASLNDTEVIIQKLYLLYI